MLADGAGTSLERSGRWGMGGAAMVADQLRWCNGWNGDDVIAAESAKSVTVGLKLSNECDWGLELKLNR